MGKVSLLELLVKLRITSAYVALLGYHVNGVTMDWNNKQLLDVNGNVVLEWNK